MSGYISPSKYFPLQRTHISQRCFHFLKQPSTLFCDDLQLRCRIWLNLRNRLKSPSFEGFKFCQKEKITRSKVRLVRVIGKNSDRVFDQKLASSEYWVDWSFVVMEKPVVTSPQFWSFASDNVPRTFQYFNVVNLVDCAALRKVLVANNTLSRKENC